MPKNPVLITPSVIKWARESSGYTVKEVVDKLNRKTITAQTISDWENGQAFPSYPQLEKLAYEIYKRPVAVFFFPDPPDESDIKKSFRTLPKPVEKLKPSMRILLRKARFMQFNLMELIGSDEINKKIFKEITFRTNASVKSLTHKVRNYLGISLEEQKKWKDPTKALNQWREAVQSCGVFVFKNSFKESDFSGFCLYDTDFPVIYINSKQAPARQIFTLFHELAHILFQTSGFDPSHENYFRGQLTSHNKKIETICNEFAGAFLVPDESLDSQIQRFDISDLDDISRLAKEYSVSSEVILRRLLKNQMLLKENYRRLVKEAQETYWTHSQKRKTRKVNPFIVKESHLGKKYISIVFSKYYKNQISLEQAADFLDVKPDFALSLEPDSRIPSQKKRTQKKG